MTIAEQEWDRAVAVLDEATEVALACHIDPDGDALGSMLALQRFLDGRGVRTHTSFGTPAGSGGGQSSMVVPPQYTFLPGLDTLTPPAAFPRAPGVLVAFDTGSPERLGSLRPAAEHAGTVIVLDHHASGLAFGDVRLIDPSAAATVVLVDQLIRRMGGAADRDIATCLYVGLVTDTGRFQHPSTTPEVMHLAARLIAEGIDHAAISRQVWETHSFGYLKVLGRALERAALVPEAGLVWTVVFQRDLEELGITLAETEGLIDVLRAAESAECTLVCKELGDGSWKASLRSKGAIDVGDVAIALGGGGHAYAAGFLARGTLDEVVARVTDVLVMGGQPATTAGG
jgi:bifunctional oligoribonuclease and PAP phosphatase NrnA